MPRSTVPSPIGNLTITSDGKRITHVNMTTKKYAREDDELTKRCAQAVKKYFHGVSRKFAVPIHTEGTEFQESVWREIRKIPYGKVATYGDIAKRIGKPSAVRAVANACGKNPLLIVVPCHRIVSAAGLGGYAAGMTRKKWLLTLEKK